MTARFRAHGTFTVPGRGLVVAGEIVDGIVKIGMTARVPSWPCNLTIAGVELIRSEDGIPANVGLVFASQNDAEFARWKSLDLQGQTLEIWENISKSAEL